MDISLSLREEDAHIGSQFYFFHYYTISRQATWMDNLHRRHVILFMLACFERSLN